MRSASSSSSCSGTSRSHAAVAAMSPEKPTRPSWKRRPFSTVSTTSHGVIPPLNSRSRPAEVPAAGYDVVSIPPSRRQRRRRRRRSDARLEGTLAVGDDPLLAPLRVAWLPPKRDGVPRARLARLLSIGDPRDPGRLRQTRVLRRHPDRCRVVVAEPAPASELRARWHRAGGTDAAHTAGLPEFVARQAALALDRAEPRPPPPPPQGPPLPPGGGVRPPRVP